MNDDMKEEIRATLNEQKLIDKIRAKINETCGAEKGFCTSGDCCSYKFEDILEILEIEEAKLNNYSMPQKEG